MNVAAGLVGKLQDLERFLGDGLSACTDFVFGSSDFHSVPGGCELVATDTA